METVHVGWQLAVLLVLLATAAAGITRASALGDWRAPLTATARAVVQLAAVSLVIAFVIRSMWLTVGFVAFMVLVAALTSSRRISGRLGWPMLWMTLPILTGVVPVLVAAVCLDVIPLEPLAVLPIAGILIGGSMTAATLAGRRTFEELTSQHGPYEAALSLGLPRREAVGLIARPMAGLALIPGLDQTRTVGLVTLPGAFVGMLLSGASPAQAGAAQALVLVALLFAQAIAGALTVELIATARLPREGQALPA